MKDEKKTTPEEIEYIETSLENLRKTKQLLKRKYDLIEKHYEFTESGLESAQMKYQQEPEFLAISLELDKLEWDDKLAKLEYNIAQTENLLNAKKRVLGEKDE